MMMGTLRYKTMVWQWIAGVVCALLVQTAHAATQDIRVVGVGVDSSSIQAEEYALEYAKKRAAFLAARKMGARDANRALAKLSEDQWREIIRGATVGQSRREGYTTYIEANVTIVPDAIRRILKLPASDEKLNFSDYDTRGVLLLSAYIGKERAYLWEKENVLRGPVSDEIMRQSRGAVLLPGGDLDDLKLIDYQNAMTVKPDELKPMFERYGAEEIIIAALKLGEPGTLDASNIVLRRLRLDGMRNETFDIPVENAEETTQMRLQKAATSIASAVTQIATSTAEREAKIRESAKQLKVRFSYRTPKDLAKVQELVRTAPEVLYLEVPSIALARVSGTIYLKGDETALRERLSRQGVIISTISEGWRLSMQ